MNKSKLLLIIISLAFIVFIFFSVLRPAINGEEGICVQASKQFDAPSKARFVDASSNLVFCESESGVMPVLTNKEFTKVKNTFRELDFQEFKEEKVERGLISWQVEEDPKEKFSMISGFANDEVKSIKLNSEAGIQPNRIYLREDLWLWYFIADKGKINMPVEVMAIDENGNIISEDNE
ncbi:hypothetical protein ACA29_03765 [Lederbergia galactosidilytica]|uniref:Uncharacterized protein n=1 Tax=Lederbergia galactosidilytica TaxID=217031 RepID=A0A0Q9Y770_9BACI|nr:hypothetical protein ACA29_03765 [Lederbergia galactosidilytica]